MSMLYASIGNNELSDKASYHKWDRVQQDSEGTNEGWTAFHCEPQMDANTRRLKVTVK